MLTGNPRDELHLLLPGLLTLMMVEVAGVIAKFVDMLGNLSGQTVVFLQVDRQVRLAA